MTGLMWIDDLEAPAAASTEKRSTSPTATLTVPLADARHSLNPVAVAKESVIVAEQITSSFFSSFRTTSLPLLFD